MHKLNDTAVVALIPARAGSKGLPNKNIADCNGEPLIAYTIKAALAAQCFSQIIVSSDGEKILSIASSHGASPLLRPHCFASDQATSDSVIMHAIEKLNLLTSSRIVLLQPTSPLRTKDHILQALSLYEREPQGAVISVANTGRHHPAKAFVTDEHGLLRGMMGPDAPFQARQELPVTCFPNGAIYIFSVKDFLAEGGIPRKHIRPFFMSEKESVDIDDNCDLLLAAELLRETGEI